MVYRPDYTDYDEYGNPYQLSNEKEVLANYMDYFRSQPGLVESSPGAFSIREGASVWMGPGDVYAGYTSPGETYKPITGPATAAVVAPKPLLKFPLKPVVVGAGIGTMLMLLLLMGEGRSNNNLLLLLLLGGGLGAGIGAGIGAMSSDEGIKSWLPGMSEKITWENLPQSVSEGWFWNRDKSTPTDDIYMGNPNLNLNSESIKL